MADKIAIINVRGYADRTNLDNAAETRLSDKSVAKIPVAREYIDLLEGNTVQTIKSSLRLDPHPDLVDIVVIDMNNNYAEVAARYFPNARIIYDCHHEVELQNSFIKQSYSAVHGVGFEELRRRWLQHECRRKNPRQEDSAVEEK